MLRKTFVTLAEPPVAAAPAPDGEVHAPASPGRDWKMLSLERLQARTNEVLFVSFTRLEMRQLLTALERVEHADHDRAFDVLREKLKTELQRSEN